MDGNGTFVIKVVAKPQKSIDEGRSELIAIKNLPKLTRTCKLGIWSIDGLLIEVKAVRTSRNWRCGGGWASGS